MCPATGHDQDDSGTGGLAGIDDVDQVVQFRRVDVGENLERMVEWYTKHAVVH